MKYCRHCVLPDTRPNLTLDATDLCNACRAHTQKPVIDWSQRKMAFKRVVDRAKNLSQGYDCLIPVSGGKDSTWQVAQCLSYGLKPLAITWRTPARTPEGETNLRNLKELGVDHIDYQINPSIESQFMKKAFLEKGDPAIPMHLAIFNLPRRIASNYRIPLIVWGENSAFEYGGTKEEQEGFCMDAAWIRKFGATAGTVAKDWVCNSLSEKDLYPYSGPPDEEMRSTGTLSVFLGYYFQWDPTESLRVAESHGFQRRLAGPKTGLYDYADIDDDFISIHHYLKWFKFGFTRLFDNLSLEIRNKRISREEALTKIRELGEQRPAEDIEKFCAFTGLTLKQFSDQLERFRNGAIWKKKSDVWYLPGFLISDWNWS